MKIKKEKMKAGNFLAFFIALCLFFSFSPKQVFAQYTDTNTVSVSTYTSFEEVPIEKVNLKPHSPTKAILMSTFVPGLGQAYNKQYWKIPIVYAAAAAVTFFAIDNYKGARKFLNEYKYRINNNVDYEDPNYQNYPNDNVLYLYESYQKNFELSIILGGVVYLLNILDAYVSAHLFTFNLSDDLSMQFSPVLNYSNYHTVSYTPFSKQPELGLQVRFNFK